MSTKQAPEIRLQALTEHAQFAQCVAVQDEVWGYDISSMMTQQVFLLAANIGGQVIGAYDGDKLVGYAMSLPGFRNGHAYLHSHHLAVLADWRNFGVGRWLKLAQRDDALARGIELMEWTYDPLEIKNAHLNIAKLGTISRRYRRNFYGESSSPLHGGLPTDRIVAEWWLKSDRVERSLRGEAPVMEAVAHVDVPAAIYKWKSSPEERDSAREVQAENADELEAGFARGLSVLGYSRNAQGDGRFLLGRWNEDFEY